MLSRFSATVLAVLLSINSSTYQDTAFGVPCRYVDGDEKMSTLKCRKLITQEDWETPADGWKEEELNSKIYIYQVFDKDDILLLPTDYGSNKYVIVGLDGEKPDCDTCGR